MHGPKPAGFWTSRGAPAGGLDFKHLRVGQRYHVVRPFTDFDGHLHQSGEAWVFRGYGFLPYESGLSLFVSLDGEQEWHIRLWWDADGQADIIEALADYVTETALDG